MQPGAGNRHDERTRCHDALGALDVLRREGLTFDPDEVRVEARNEAFAVRLPGDRLAWIPRDAQGADRLAIENKVLTLLAERCGFRVPTVLRASPEGWTVRSVVRGTVDPDALAARMKSEPALVPQVAADLAGILAEQHSRIEAADVAGWLPTAPDWPMSREDIDAKLPYVLTDAALMARIDGALDAYGDLATGEQDRVLVHTDLGLHNMAVDLETGGINGIFDYRDAAWADRHLDFRYLVFSAVPDALLNATMRAYGDLTGVALSRQRVLLCNAAVAISHLAFRAGHGPEDVLGGRTLVQDLGWTDWALRRCGFPR